MSNHDTPEAELVHAPPSTPPGESHSDGLDARLKRLEDSIAGLRSQALVPAPNEDQLAERVLNVLTAKAAEHRAANGHGPPGLIMPERGYGASMPAEFGTVSLGQSLWSLFIVGFLGEIKMMARMYFDPRYRVSRVAQLGVPIILALFVLNYFFFNYSCVLPVPVLPLVAERIVGILLSLVLYKLLIREVARYRQVLDYLARYG